MEQNKIKEAAEKYALADWGDNPPQGVVSISIEDFIAGANWALSQPLSPNTGELKEKIAANLKYYVRVDDYGGAEIAFGLDACMDALLALFTSYKEEGDTKREIEIWNNAIDAAHEKARKHLHRGEIQESIIELKKPLP